MGQEYAEKRAKRHPKEPANSIHYTLLGCRNDHEHHQIALDLPSSRVADRLCGHPLRFRAGAKVHEFLESGLEPANSYLVTLDEKGKLQWTTDGPDGSVVYDKEPHTKGWDRFMMNVIKAIPMESEL